MVVLFVVKLGSGFRKATLVLPTLLLLSSLTSLVVNDATPATPEVNEWTNMTPDMKPPRRSGHAMAYDWESDRAILFGGASVGGFLDDTWVYDFNSNTWTNMKPDTQPSPRAVHEMAYDAESDRVILFGGYILLEGGGGYRENGETWAYDLNTDTWTKMEPTMRPSPRAGPDMVYDVESDRVVLYGGSPGGDETWAYDFNSNTWTNMKPEEGPPRLDGHAMAYDAESDRVVLFGVVGWMETPRNETWAYDYDTNTWTKMSPEVAPSPRVAYAMTYAAESDWIILFGGASSQTTALDDTWAYDYDSDTWTNMKPDTAPSEQSGHAMAYDGESDRVILHGSLLFWGKGNTWAYQHALEKPPPIEEAPEVGLDEELHQEEEPPGISSPRLTPLIAIVATAVVLAVAAVVASLVWRGRGKETRSGG